MISLGPQVPTEISFLFSLTLQASKTFFFLSPKSENQFHFFPLLTVFSSLSCHNKLMLITVIWNNLENFPSISLVISPLSS